MIAVDTSVLAWAMNRHGPEHARAARLVDTLANGEAPWALPWPALHELVRRVTHPHVTPRPLGLREAVGYVEALLASPSAVALGPTARHAETLAELVAAGGPGRMPGLELAAVLREHGIRELLSADASMRRFRFLTVIDPVHGPAWEPGAAPGRRYRRLRP